MQMICTVFILAVGVQGTILGLVPGYYYHMVIYTGKSESRLIVILGDDFL